MIDPDYWENEDAFNLDDLFVTAPVDVMMQIPKITKNDCCAINFIKLLARVL